MSPGDTTTAVRATADDDHRSEVPARDAGTDSHVDESNGVAHAADERRGDVAHRAALLELPAHSLFGEPWPELAQKELRVDGRTVEPLRELRDEVRRLGPGDRDSERNRSVWRRRQRPLDRLVDHRDGSEHVGRHEHPRRAELELERSLECLLHGRRGRLWREASDLDAADRDSEWNRRLRVRRRGRRREHTGDEQAGNDREQEGDALHVFNVAKIRGSLVMIPSAPSRTNLSASLGSSTVHT